MITIPLWYCLCLGAAGAYFGFCTGRTVTLGQMEKGELQKTENRVSCLKREGVVIQTDSACRVVVSPSGGLLEKVEEEEVAGVRIHTTESRLFSPAAGKIMKISPRGNSFVIRTDTGEELTVSACSSEDDLLDRYFRPRVIRGEVVHCGQQLLEYDREQLCRLCEDTTVRLTVRREDTEGLEITGNEQVRRGEAVLWISGIRQDSSERGY